MAKAVALVSGSLASLVAVRLVIQEPAISEVRLLHLRSPFFRDYEQSKDLTQRFFSNCFRSQSIKRDFKELTNIADQGRYSLKSCCTGCRQVMLTKAWRYMKKIGADFIVSGEIVGTRGLDAPDVQQLTAEIGLEDLVLRPLSAHHLPETLPERAGWVARSRLKGFTEKDRWTHLPELARRLGIDCEGFSAETRCKLTHPHFGQRLEDLLREECLTMNTLELLEFPYYYKSPPDVKIVLGTSDEEKRRLQDFFLPDDLRLYVPSPAGPMALVRANWKAKSPPEIYGIIELAARITATYSKNCAKNGHLRRIQANYRFENSQETYRINVPPFQSESELEHYCSKVDL
jgi:hypothetical protein